MHLELDRERLGFKRKYVRCKNKKGYQSFLIDTPFTLVTELAP